MKHQTRDNVLGCTSEDKDGRLEVHLCDLTLGQGYEGLHLTRVLECTLEGLLRRLRRADEEQRIAVQRPQLPVIVSHLQADLLDDVTHVLVLPQYQQTASYCLWLVG